MNSPPVGAFDSDSAYQTHGDVDIVVFPTFLDLKQCIDAKIITGSQHGHSEEHGAHTGDISLKMCKDLGCIYALCGHSERRADHEETNEDVAAQAIAALELGLHPIICVGETEQERDAGHAEEIVQQQIQSLFDHSQLSTLNSQLSIAYEPVWAIGTGKTATPQQAQEMHAFIRSLLPDDRSDVTRILYGGSMKPENAEELLSQSDIDGGLIGGASLKPEQFAEIVAIASQLAA